MTFLTNSPNRGTFIVVAPLMKESIDKRGNTLPPLFLSHPSSAASKTQKQYNTATHQISDRLVVGELFLHVDVEVVPVGSLGVLHEGLKARLEVIEVLQVSNPHPVAHDLRRVRRSDALIVGAQVLIFI